MGDNKSQSLGDRLFRVGNKLLKVEVFLPPKCNTPAIMNDGKRTTPLNLYLSACREERNWAKIPYAIQLDVLRHDADAHKVFKNNVQCKACMRLLKIGGSQDGPEPGVFTLAGWLEHKLRCRDLQDQLQEEYDDQNYNPQAVRRAVSNSIPSSGRRNKSTAPDSGAISQLSGDDATGDFERRICFARRSESIEEVVIAYAVVNGGKAQHFHVVVEGKRHTPFKFLVLGKKQRGSHMETMQFVRQDVDADYCNNAIRCKGCSKNINIHRRDSNKITLDPWLEHKFLCKDLQEIYREEFEDYDPAEAKQRREVKDKSPSRRTMRHIPATTSTTTLRPKTRAPISRVSNSAPAESLAVDVVLPGPTSARSSKKRTFNFVDDSNSQPGEFLQCKKRHIDASGEVDEVEIGFPPGFAFAHPEVIVKIMNSFRGTD
ncbi:hypothetical protein SCHPADRAFT_943545 [Schizopora paradoxa]|uniref:Uncharacterized protein n=1 Tax=Schizopora paradoxa TaxID=27342 RepID=A0A0H2RXR6_9AGAM|nr:hypothetical protein SCHPADRAFT_943545 [Schizopora paradoxa]